MAGSIAKYPLYIFFSLAFASPVFSQGLPKAGQNSLAHKPEGLEKKIVMQQQQPFSKLPGSIQHPELAGQLAYDKFLEMNKRKNMEQFPASDALRISTSGLFELNMEDIVNGPLEDAPMRLRHLAAQLYNVFTGPGFTDAAIKSAWMQQPNLPYGDFWVARGKWHSFGGMIIALQAGSAIEYGLNNGKTLGDAVRLALSQAIVSHIGEHLGYWIGVNSGLAKVDEWRGNKGYFNWWSGPRYPDDPKGQNDAPWMNHTFAYTINRILHPNDPENTVRQSDIFTAFALSLAAAYVINPSTKAGEIKPNKITKFTPYLFFDADHETQGPGILDESLKMGLKYGVPFTIADFSPEIAMYQSAGFTPVAELSFVKPELNISGAIGADNRGMVGLSELSATFHDGKNLFTITYKNTPEHGKIYFLGFGLTIN